MTMMMTERATDKARMMTVPWLDVLAVRGLFQPVGKVDRSKSAGGGEGSDPGGLLLLMSFCSVSGSDEGGGHGSCKEKSGGQDLEVMEMVRT